VPGDESSLRHTVRKSKKEVDDTFEEPKSQASDEVTDEQRISDL
jgi:hypothetical protein